MEQHNDTITPLTDQQILDTIRQAIALFQRKVQDGNVAVTTGDLIRLLELEAAFSKRTETQEIIATWVDPKHLQEEPEAD